MLRLVQSMATAVSYKESNVEMNRKVWDRYAKDWSKDTDWVVKMAENLGNEWKGGEGLVYVGDEWSDRASLQVFSTDHLADETLESCVYFLTRRGLPHSLSRRAVEH